MICGEAFAPNNFSQITAFALASLDALGRSGPAAQPMPSCAV